MNPRKKVAFYTLGCKLNFSETSTIARSFNDEGFDRVNFSEKADMYVINTCSVTENADRRFKDIVKQAQKGNIYKLSTGAVITKNKEILVIKRIISDFYGGIYEIPSGKI